MDERENLPFGKRLMYLLLDDGEYTWERAAQVQVDWARFGRALPDISYETLRKAVGGLRPPSVSLMEQVADFLGVEPTVFREYRLAQAREAFDPEVVGEDAALANLQLWERAGNRSRTRA